MKRLIASGISVLVFICLFISGHKASADGGLGKIADNVYSDSSVESRLRISHYDIA